MFSFSPRYSTWCFTLRSREGHAGRWGTCLGPLAAAWPSDARGRACVRAPLAHTEPLDVHVEGSVCPPVLLSTRRVVPWVCSTIPAVQLL